MVKGVSGQGDKGVQGFQPHRPLLVSQQASWRPLYLRMVLPRTLRHCPHSSQGTGMWPHDGGSRAAGALPGPPALCSAAADVLPVLLAWPGPSHFLQLAPAAAGIDPMDSYFPETNLEALDILVLGPGLSGPKGKECSPWGRACIFVNVISLPVQCFSTT